MSAPDEHEALVQAIRSIITNGYIYSNPAARAILALVAERLEKPTEAMIEAWRSRENEPLEIELDWSAMLAASPLKPKKLI